MAAIAATLNEFSTSENSRTWTTTGHTPLLPKLVIQKRRVPVGKSSVSETQVTVVYGCSDSEGVVLPAKVAIGSTCRIPVAASGTTAADALVLYRDIVNSDEFAAMFTSQNFLK
jgi:hypothetical protein